MPLYGTVPNANILPLTAGQQLLVFNGETVPVGSASLPIQFRNNDSLSNYYSVEYAFSADPGAYTLAVQHADIDMNSHYVTMASQSAGLNAAHAGRIEVLVVARANSVALTAGFMK